MAKAALRTGTPGSESASLPPPGLHSGPWAPPGSRRQLLLVPRAYQKPPQEREAHPPARTRNPHSGGTGLAKQDERPTTPSFFPDFKDFGLKDSRSRSRRAGHALGAGLRGKERIKQKRGHRGYQGRLCQAAMATSPLPAPVDEGDVSRSRPGF